MAKRLTKEERMFWGKMAADARNICWKLQNNIPLNNDDQETLTAMPQDVQRSIREVGSLRR